MKEEQLEFPYPIGDLILYPVLTKAAIDRIGIKNLCLTDFILNDCDVDYTKMEI